MIGRGYCWKALTAWIVLVGTVPKGYAQDQVENREDLIKAGYLYNFSLYIDWPKNGPLSSKEEFCIGVWGKGGVVPYLQKIAQTKTIHDKKIVVTHFETAKDYKPCHVLFLTAESAESRDETAEQRLQEALKRLKGQSVLLITESEGFAEKGSMINFYIEENKMKFEINPDAAKVVSLQISSKLLRLGKIVPGPKK